MRGRITRLRAGLAVALALAALAAPAASADDVAVQRDGKIVVAGTTPLGSGYLARLDPDGTPDLSFGIRGVMVEHQSTGFFALALGPNGSIFALSKFTVARYEFDGRLDRSFGTDGFAPFSKITDPTDLVLLPDGRILVAGDESIKWLSPEGLLVLLSADGRSQEWVNGMGYGIYTSDLVGEADGSVLMLGRHAPPRSLLARFAPGAAPSFGESFSTFDVPQPEPGYEKGFADGAGVATVRWPGKRSPRFSGGALAAASSGIFVGGTAGRRLALARLSVDGRFDGGFGGDGFATVGGTKRLGTTSAVAATGEGPLLFGDFRPPHSSHWCETCRTPVLARFLPDGERDPTFGNGGRVTLPGVEGPTHGAASGDLVPLEGGKILASALPGESSSQLVLARFGPRGAADRSFGSGGVVRFEACGGSEVEQRETGCLPSAGADLEVHRGSAGKVSLRLEVFPREGWWELDSLRVEPPPSFVFRRDRAAQATFSYRGYGRRLWQQPALIRAGALVFHRENGMEAGPIHLFVPAGVLRRVGELPRSLLLRVRVGFSPGYRHASGVQSLLVREAPDQSR